MRRFTQSVMQRVTGITAIIVVSSLSGFAQQTPQAPPQPAPPQQPAPQQQAPQPPPPGQSLAPDQLNDLVAPVALYPDPLLSQILVASTYPLELVQLQQWLDRNPGLTGTALVQAVEQQNWDPSIQAMAVFPDLVKRLNQDITWTTNLGNTFLIQQADVMDAVQRMRAQAQSAGKLSSTPEQTVTTTTDNGQPVIQIQPANPQVIYVPYYNPVSIWGPSLYYPYASWYYPPFYGGGYFGFGYGIRIGAFFGGGWGGWGGWGWSPGWGNRTIIVNNTFIHRNNFNGGYRGGLTGTGAWAHNSVHRQGVPYANSSLNSRYGGGVRQNLAAQNMNRSYSPRFQSTQRMGNRSVPSNSSSNANRGAFGGVRSGSAARAQSDHGYSSLGPNRSGTARSAPAARSSAPSGSRFSGGSAPRSAGGGGGAIRGGGGGGGFRGGVGGGGNRGGGGGGNRGGGGGGRR